MQIMVILVGISVKSLARLLACIFCGPRYMLTNPSCRLCCALLPLVISSLWHELMRARYNGSHFNVTSLVVILSDCVKRCIQVSNVHETPLTSVASDSLSFLLTRQNQILKSLRYVFNKAY